MQLKATKLAAILSRLHSALRVPSALALFAVLGLCAAAPLTAKAECWVRFTYVKKYAAQGTLDVSSLALARFAIFDAGGTCLIPNAGLTKGSSATALGENEFWQNMGDSNAGNLFTPGMGSGEKWTHSDATVPVVWTMRLADGAVPAQYNLAVADVTVTVGETNLLGRYPTSWKVETSTTGEEGSWTTVSTVNDVTPPSTAGSWYNGGGNNPTPSKFYPLTTSSTYTPVTYIKTTKSQCIQTGYTPTPKTWMDARIAFGPKTTWSIEGTIKNIFSASTTDGNQYSANFGGNSDQSGQVFFLVGKST